MPVEISTLALGPSALGRRFAPGEGMTIHKSQGQTSSKVVDLGKGEKVAGCTFVATSRVRSINIVFEPMTFDRLRAICRNKNMQKRIEEEQRLVLISDETLQKYSHK